MDDKEIRFKCDPWYKTRPRLDWDFTLPFSYVWLGWLLIVWEKGYWRETIRFGWNPD